MLCNPCRYLDKINSMILQLNHILSNLYISKSLQYDVWRQGSMNTFQYIRWQLLYIKFHLVSNFMIVILDTQVLFLAKLTHVGRWTQTTSSAPNSRWTTSTLSILHKFNYMIKINTTTKVCHSILEKLYPKTWVKATQQGVNTSKCLNEKWQPHFELKRWVWPMIKCLHLNPKSIYSNIGDFVADQF